MYGMVLSGMVVEMELEMKMIFVLEMMNTMMMIFQLRQHWMISNDYLFKTENRKIHLEIFSFSLKMKKSILYLFDDFFFQV